ncbi:hypothetical protein ACFPOE_04770 [Caenimonas terrae]|uniref:Pentapeptide MXKDX repeat protein n=1 Tax=Caenimonas terrae TaxID=696074 RepID=A0ABW0ND46_9BURK
MNKLLALLLASLFATASFAASHMGAAPMTSAANPNPTEAMKAGDAKAEAAAQAKVDARMKIGDKTAMQPEAMKAGDAKAQANAEMKKAKKVAKKKNSTDEQMKKDAAKL